MRANIGGGKIDRDISIKMKNSGRVKRMVSLKSEGKERRTAPTPSSICEEFVAVERRNPRVAAPKCRVSRGASSRQISRRILARAKDETHKWSSDNPPLRRERKREREESSRHHASRITRDNR